MRTRLYAGALALLSSAVVFGACGSSSHTHTPSSVDPNAPTVDLTAKSFSFDPKDITLKAGEAKTIALHVKDIPHDFTVKELGIHFGADGGHSALQTITVDKPGTYQYYCSVSGHREAGMHGTLTVQ